jgi:hypothetical protein
MLDQCFAIMSHLGCAQTLALALLALVFASCLHR